MTGMTAVRYDPETGNPQADMSTEMDMRSEGS